MNDYPVAASVVDRALQFWGPSADAITPLALNDAVLRATGLPDLHPHEIAEPLELLCADFAKTRPSALGRLAVRSTLIEALSARRSVQHANAPVRPRLAPVVIIGFYRTGTTLLHELLGALPESRWAPTHRMVNPVPSALSVPRTALGCALIQTLAPELRYLHAVRAKGPFEGWSLLAQHLLMDGVTMHWPLPEFDGWLQRVDRRPAYRAWAASVALIEGASEERLVLKDPSHLLGVDALLNAIPDARIIWTHRDPIETVRSTAALTAVQHRSAYGVWDTARAIEAATSRYERTMLAARDKAAAICDAHLVHVEHKELREDPIATMRRIADTLDLPWDRAALDAALERRRLPKRPPNLNTKTWPLDVERVAAAGALERSLVC